MLSSMALLPGVALADDELVWDVDTIIDLTGTDIQLTILAGSAATSLVVNPTSIVVDVDGLDTFTVSAVAGATKLVNSPNNTDGCAKTNGLSRLALTADVAVTITPTASGCSVPSVGGGGGGGYSAPAVTSCTVLTPNGGNTLTGGSSSSISWSTSGTSIKSVLVSQSLNAGQSWSTVAAIDTTNGGSTAWAVPNASTTTGKIKVECRDVSGATLASDTSDSNFSIATDAAKPTDVVTPTGTYSRSQANASLPASAPVDSLVKLATNSAVYYIGLDGKRHPFPTSQVYFSWYADFSKVKTLNASEMASIPMGKPILARPGTHWVKIQSDPKTYFVSPDGYTLRWIKDEATALLLGGSDWNKNIIDVEPTYFTKYNMGADIDSVALAAGWPAGSLVKGADGKTWYVTATNRREVLASGMSGNSFQNKFVESSSTGGWQSLPIGTAVSGTEDDLFSVQNL